MYAADEDAGVYLEEDLGDSTLFDALSLARQTDGSDFPAEMVPVYQRVLEVLPRFQVEGGKVVDYSVAYPRAAFDRQSILWDLNYFKYHFLKLAHVPFNESRLEKDFRRLTTFLLGADTRHFMYRDFQSRNVMLRDGEPWFIDYQGGRRGALQYDVASLLFDPKAAIPEALREQLLEHYLDSLEKYLRVDREQFRQHFRGYVFVRIMQAMGAYGYRGFFERKPRFLASVPQAVRNVERLLETGFLPIDLPELRGAFEYICASRTLRKTPVQVPPGLTVQVGSFSYKNGYPEDSGGHGGGFVFDCRALHNPGRYAEYAGLCGCDEPVVKFLEDGAGGGGLLEARARHHRRPGGHLPDARLHLAQRALRVHGGAAPLRVLRRAAGEAPRAQVPAGERGPGAPGGGALAGPGRSRGAALRGRGSGDGGGGLTWTRCSSRRGWGRACVP